MCCATGIYPSFTKRRRVSATRRLRRRFRARRPPFAGTSAAQYPRSGRVARAPRTAGRSTTRQPAESGACTTRSASGRPRPRTTRHWPGASTPASSSPAARHPPRVARRMRRAPSSAARASGAGRRRALLPPAIGVTGESEPKASSTPARAMSAYGLSPPARSTTEPGDVHPVVSRPSRVERRLHAGHHPRRTSSTPGRLRSSPRAPAGAVHPARRRGHTARPRDDCLDATHGGVADEWKPAWTPALVHATTCSVAAERSR